MGSLVPNEVTILEIAYTLKKQWPLLYEWDTSVSKVVTYGPDDWRLIPGRGRPLRSLQTGSGANPSSYINTSCDSVPGVKYLHLASRL